MQCLDCERPMVAKTRAKGRPEGFRVHKSRGLCDPCHKRATRLGELDAYEPRKAGNHDEPPATPGSIERTRQELTAYIRARRTRLAG